ncbi:MAG: hypothetical protein ACYTEQ_06495 [Planctomycetota bacterium]|jgi:hypothetical protein
MTQTQIASGAGLRNIRAWKIDSDGYPNDTQSGTNGYAGFLIDGAKSFTSNVPDSQIVAHTGNDQPFAQDVLPPTELENAALTTAKTNLSADALLTDTLVQDLLGDLVMGGMSTSKQGCEPQIVLMGWRQALDTDPNSASFGQRRYNTNMYPSARTIPQGGNAEEGGDDVNNYNVVPTSVTDTPWGVTFTEVTNGYTRTQRLRFISTNPLMMESFDTDGAETEFSLDFTPISTTKTRVWYYGSPQTVSAVNTTTKTFTLSSAPASATGRLVALYETTEICGA